MTTDTIHVNSTTFKVLHTISTMLQSVETIFKQVVPPTIGVTQDDFKRAVLTPMVQAGYIEVDDFDLVTPTDAGMSAYKRALDAEEAGAAPVATAPATTPPRLRAAAGAVAGPRNYQPPRGDYQGLELGRTCQRPGAYDFLQHPSLINGRPAERKTA